MSLGKERITDFFFLFCKVQKRRSKLFSFCNYANLDMENEKFSIFAPFRIGKTGAKILSFEESLFWHPGLFTVFPDRYANWNVGLADKKWSKLLIPIARPLSIAKGVWNVPRLRKRWFVDPMVSFILQNAKCTEKIAGNLLFLSSEHLKSIQNDQNFHDFFPFCNYEHFF